VLHQGRKKKSTVTKQVHLVKQQHSRKGSIGTTAGLKNSWRARQKNIQMSPWSMEAHSAQCSELQLERHNQYRASHFKNYASSQKVFRKERQADKILRKKYYTKLFKSVVSIYITRKPLVQQ